MRASYGLSVLLLGLAGCVPSFDGLVVVDDAGAGMDAAARDAGTPPRDAGVDAGRDAAGDSGSIPGDDAGDGGLDGGVEPDAGLDAARPDAGADAGCTPSCLIGAACGGDDGCGGRCLGDCPVPEDELCYGGLCFDSWCAPSACDAFSGTGCEVGQACYATLADAPSYEETACGAPGSGFDADPCTTNAQCAAGYGCRLGRCRRYCCHAGDLFVSSSDHCPHYCERLGTRLGYCVVTCNTLDPDSCAADQVCVRSAERAGLMYCIESVAPTASAGDACSFANACAHGQLCHDFVCRTTCDPGGDPCPGATTCTGVLTTPAVSLCLPD